MSWFRTEFKVLLEVLRIVEYCPNTRFCRWVTALFILTLLYFLNPFKISAQCISAKLEAWVKKKKKPNDVIVLSTSSVIKWCLSIKSQFCPSKLKHELWESSTCRTEGQTPESSAWFCHSCWQTFIETCSEFRYTSWCGGKTPMMEEGVMGVPRVRR